MMARRSFLFWSLFYFASICETSKILMVYSIPSVSHHILGFRLAKELALTGHDVTFASPYPQKTSVKNIQEVSLEHMVKYINEIKKNFFNRNEMSFITNTLVLSEFSSVLAEKTLQTEAFQKVLAKETFDLIIVEYFFNDALLGLGHHFRAPIITTNPTGTSIFSSHVVVNPLPSSYIPNIMGSLTKNMNFFERLRNVYMNQVMDLIRLSYFPVHQRMFKKYLKSDGIDLQDVNISLMLSNSHISINDPVPLVPTLIEIGGFHIDAPKKLPVDLQEFLDGAEDGAIYFSMGSNLKSKDLRPEMRKALLQTFGKLKQKVLWKFEGEIEKLPANVKVEKWLPQQDVLAHPNVLVFITHGGLLSSIETIYHGVPIVGIPVYGDQGRNIAAAVNNGYALSVPLMQLNEESLSKALNEMINNPKYRENAKMRSTIMHDRPMKALETAVYWIEYVIRHKGAPHLRHAGVDLAWYQRENVDVILFSVFISLAVFVALYHFVKKICSLFGSKNLVDQKKKKLK